MTISEVGKEEGKLPVRIYSSQNWSLYLQFEGQSRNWARLDLESGDAGLQIVHLSFDENKSGQKRKLKIIAEGRGFISAWDFTQSSSATSSIPSGIIEDPVANWMELPAISSSDNLYFFSHERSNGERDWSFYWDKDDLVARWVAYPLNANLIGSGTRTDQWGEDPHLPRHLQPILRSGFKSDIPGRGYCQRGHQIPSADRLRYDDNVRTFYGTNMTPQLNSFNGRVWASLEGMVRDWARSFDTLYVVTGCVGHKKDCKAWDNDGKSVAVPAGYFKALLGYSKSGTASDFSTTTGGFTSTAFYLNHESSSSAMAHRMTVKQLERQLGIDFFVNLPSLIGPDLADKVESSSDIFWTNN